MNQAQETFSCRKLDELIRHAADETGLHYDALNIDGKPNNAGVDHGDAFHIAFWIRLCTSDCM